MAKYSYLQLQRAVETLALQNLVLCDQVEDLERKVEFYRALSLGDNPCADAVSFGDPLGDARKESGL